MKYGACTTMEHYRELCGIGYDYLELPGTTVHAMDMAAVREAAKMIRDAGKPCIGFNAYCDGSLPIVGDGYRKEMVYAYARELCEKGSILGAGNLGIGSPAARRLPPGYDTGLADAQCSEFLRVTAEVAAEYGMQVLFESLNRTMCNYMTDTVQAWKLARGLDLDNVKLVLEFCHAALEGEKLTDLECVMPEVRHLHISGFEADGSRYHLREKDEGFCAECLSWARKLGYDGTISVEAGSSHFKDEAAASLRRLKAAEELCRTLQASEIRKNAKERCEE